MNLSIGRLFLVRAASRGALKARVDACLAGEPVLEGEGPCALAWAGRTDDESRAALEEAAQVLARGELPSRMLLRATDGRYGAASLVGLFPGQGSQAPRMLASLGDVVPGFAAARAELDERFGEVCGRRVERWIAEASADELVRTDVAQPALGLVSLALAQALGALGISPRTLIGHSYGELTALVRAGAYGARTFAALSTTRGLLLAAAGRGAPGGMLAVRATRAEVQALLAEGADLWVANENAPEQVVVAGRHEALDAFAELLRRAGLAAVRIATACAFHTPLMAAAAQSFRATLESADIAAPEGACVIANESAAPYAESAAAVRAGLVSQITAPVRFSTCVETAYARGGRVFLELGPGKVLRDLCARTLGTRPHLALALDPGTSDARTHFADVLLQLLVHGVDVAWTRGEQLAGRPRIEVPSAVPSAPESSVSSAFFAANSAAVEAFFGQQRALIERLNAAPSAALVQELAEANRLVMSEFFATQARVLGPGSEAPALPERAPRTVAVPTSVESAPASDESSELTDWLRGEIARLTGFPRELVKNESELENELGLDSITVVEIYTRLVEAYPRLAGFGAEVRKANTIGDAVQRLLSARDAGAQPGREAVEAKPEPGPVASSALEAEVLALAARASGRVVSAASAERGFAQELGLDAFARRELVAELVTRHPELEVAGRQLVFAATPRALANLCERILGDARPEPIERFVRRRIEVSAPAGGAGTGRVLVTGPESATRRAVCAALLARGATVEVVGSRDAGRCTVGDTLLAVAPEVHDDARVGALCLAGFALIKEVDAGGRPQRLCVLGLPSLAFGLARGVARALAREWPDTAVRAVRLETGLDPSSVTRGLDAVLSGPSELDLAVTSAGLERGVIESEPLSLGAARLERIPRGAHVLLLGGGDGITARIAELLARRTGARISALGRTPMPHALPNIEAKNETELRAVLREELAREHGSLSPRSLNELLKRRLTQVNRARALHGAAARIAAAGGHFAYRAADATCRAALERAIAELREEHGPIEGFVHGAGVIEDAPLAHKTRESFARVLETKLSSALYARELLAREPLRFAFLFSSLTAYTGNVGQIDYIAANEALEALAERWASEVDYPVRALAWSVWHESGLAPGWAKALIAQGRITGISDARGGELFWDELVHAERGPHSVLLTSASTLAFVENGGMAAELEAHG